MIIEIKDLSKIYNNNYVLKDINLEISHKETVCVIGPSGSGKSTLLRCINCLIKPDRGTVHIDQELVNSKTGGKNTAKIATTVGMVFQQFNLFDHWTVLKNLTYAPMTILNFDKESAVTQATKLLEEFNISNKVLDKPKNLSGGQKQKVAICRALMMKPKIMLFDEPTSALDQEIIQDYIAIINALKLEMTMIIVTHDIKLAQLVADRIIFMDKGYILTNQIKDHFFSKTKGQRAKLFLKNVELFL